MSAIRTDRKSVIRQLVQANAVRTQGELTQLLKEHGFEVTQATVSRDMADLSLQKDASGVYVTAELLHLRAVLQTQLHDVRRAGNQVVVISGPGAAQGVAAAIDAVQPEGVLGTLAGDDTVLVIARDDAAGAAFQTLCEQAANNNATAQGRSR